MTGVANVTVSTADDDSDDNIVDVPSGLSTSSAHLSPPEAVSHEAFESVLTPEAPIYRGSYVKTPRGSSTNLHGLGGSLANAVGHSVKNSVAFSSGQGSPDKSSGIATPVTPSKNPDLVVRASYLNFKLNQLLDKDTDIRKSYDVEELREGYFDAVFALSNKVESTIQDEYEHGQYPRPPDQFLRSWIPASMRLSFSKDKAIKLFKVFSAFFVSYILCLIHPTADWFGPLCFFMPFATIFHHPARTIGSQLEITLLSVLGGCVGLGWSSLALYISNATGPARNGYAGIHATSLSLGIFATSWVRARFIRFHHLIQTFCFTIIVMETVGVSELVHWKKVWNFGIPYLFGLLIPLVFNSVIAPDFGQEAIMKSLSTTLRDSKMFIGSLTSNDDEKQRVARQELNIRSLMLSESFRELCNEVSLLTLPSRDLVAMRNIIQVVIGRIKAVPTPSSFFMPITDDQDSSDPVILIKSHFAQTARGIVANMDKCLDVAIDYVDYLWHGGNAPIEALRDQKLAMTDSLEELKQKYITLVDIEGYDLQRFLQIPEVVNFFLYLYFIGESARVVTDLTGMFEKQCEKGRHWGLSWPIYPLKRALRRTTIQITHDKGGQSAAYYYQTKRDIDDIFQRISNSNTSRNPFDRTWDFIKQKNKSMLLDEQRGAFYHFWSAIHRLQEFETRFALKTSVCITLLSLPSWMVHSRHWYFKHDIYLCVLSAYMVFHPRVAGNPQDVIVRSTFCILGCIWAGIAARADYFNAYVMAAFCAVYMIPMLYRFIFTSHPRSGILACVSFTMVSLTMVEKHRTVLPDLNILQGTWTRFLALEVGMLVTIVLNWILWPYVARHEVRKSVSNLLAHIGQTYKIIVERYVYRDKDDIPTEVTLQLAEIREGRILQSIHALRQLLQTTHHEIPLTGAFDANLYECVIQSCETIFQKISEARISTLHFNVYDNDGSKDKTAQLLPLRRDAAVSTVFVLNMLSGAFRLKNKIPRYLPSSALSRKLLYDKITELREPDRSSEMKSATGLSHSDSDDDEDEDDDDDDDGKRHQLVLSTKRGLQSKRVNVVNRAAFWTIVHETAYSRALTETTEELEKLIVYSRLLLGQDYL